MEKSGGSSGSTSSDSGKFMRSCYRGHWRPAEDDKLLQLVQQHGPQNWNFIAEHLQGRSGKSCRLRWYNQLDPNINKKPFTEEEEENLLRGHKIYGNKWAHVAKFFYGRTDNAVKNHYHVMMARRKRERFNGMLRDHHKPPPSDYLLTTTSMQQPQQNFLGLLHKNQLGSPIGIGRTTTSSLFPSISRISSTINKDSGDDLQVFTSTPQIISKKDHTISSAVSSCPGNSSNYTERSSYSQSRATSLNPSFGDTGFQISSTPHKFIYIDVHHKTVSGRDPFGLFNSQDHNFEDDEMTPNGSFITTTNSSSGAALTCNWLPLVASDEQLQKQQDSFIDFLGVGVTSSPKQ